MNKIRHGFVLVALAILTPWPGASQSCSSLPSETNSLWIGGGLEAGAPTNRYGTRVGFNFLDRVFLGGGLATGGYDTGDAAASWREGQAGVILGLGPLSICPQFLVVYARYDYRSRFDTGRGHVRDLKLGARIPVGGPLPHLGPVSVRWFAAADLMSRRWIRAERTVTVDSVVGLARGEEEDREFLTEGMAGLTLQWKGVGFSLGVASHVFDERRLTHFFQIGLRAG